MRYPERERRRIRALRRRQPELEETLSFLERISDISVRLTTADGDVLHRLHREIDAPPLSPSRFPLDYPTAVEAFRLLLEALIEITGSDAARAILSALAEGQLDVGRLAGAYCRGNLEPFESAAARLSIDGELLWGVAELAVKPQFVAAARALESRVERPSARWAQCPACGSAPEMALVTDARGAEAIMLAVCRLCESEWPIKRVYCTFCGNEDDETLTYLQVDGEDEARVSVCEKCHHYLLVCDVRGRLECAPSVERAAITHLDILAQARGYKPLGSATVTGDGKTGDSVFRSDRTAPG